MIDLFRTWLPQIIAIAEEFQDGRLEKAWKTGQRGVAPYYSGELHEVVFGDLDAGAMREEARLMLDPHLGLVCALEGFLAALIALDDWVEAHVDTATWGKGRSIPAEVASIFLTEEWCNAQSNAAVLVSEAREAGFSSQDMDLSLIHRRLTLH